MYSIIMTISQIDLDDCEGGGGQQTKKGKNAIM